jgi:pimeloyl-ACP methyl ester carboxylesterase
MPAQVLIVHGWSDSSKSFQDLNDFLVAHGYATKQVWLTDYISMEDDVRIEDVVKRMQAVIKVALADGQISAPFDMIVHSTGGLVARDWLSRYYPDGTSAPVKRLLMLAPANFGSRLASLGKSMLGRVVKGWNNWFQTGTQMLNALELASDYQWELARRDLLDAVGTGSGPYGLKKVWPFIIVGSRGFTDVLREMVNEDGSDGTVRAAAANLNAIGMTIDFATNPANPHVTGWQRRTDARFPFAILPDRNHASIHEPAEASGAIDELSDRLGTLILNALRCETEDAYVKLAADWDEISEATATLSRDVDSEGNVRDGFNANAPKGQALHQYMQIVVYVRDDEGYPVQDYFLEFFSPDQAGSADAVYFHQKVLDDVHINGLEASRRCLFVDRTDLMFGFYPMIADPAKRQVAVSISAAEVGPSVRYFDSTRVGAKGSLVVHREADDRRAALGTACLWRNTTHLVEIVIPRQPANKVFTLL